MPGATISPVEAKIGQIIKDFSTESSFTAAAMQQFMELKAMVGEYEVQIKEYQKGMEFDKDKIGDLTSNIKTLEAEVLTLNHEIEGWRTRETETKDREDKCLRNELTAQNAEKRVEDHQNMVGLIFRNTELRKSFVGQEMMHQPGCIEIKDEYGNIKQYAEAAGYIGVPIEKVETETKE